MHIPQNPCQSKKQLQQLHRGFTPSSIETPSLPSELFTTKPATSEPMQNGKSALLPLAAGRVALPTASKKKYRKCYWFQLGN
jgi:hypothetical protein